MQQDDSTKKMFGQTMDAIGAPFDIQTAMDIQRKNIQAIAEANRRVIEGWQTLARRQTEMVSQFMQDNSTFLRTATAETENGTLGMGDQTAITRRILEQSMRNAKELSDILRTSAADANDVINRRASAAMTELRRTSDE